MPKSNRRIAALVAALLILVALLLWLTRCHRLKPVAATPDAVPPSTAASSQTAAPTVTPGTSDAPEILTPATVEAPPQVGAGSMFQVGWTGPNNRGDYITLVRREKPDGTSGVYVFTRGGSPLQMTAPIEPGDDWELRYVAAKSGKVLGRAALAVTPVGATLSAADSVTLDTPLSVAWTGPNNQGDYITIVASDAPDGKYGNYTLTIKGSPLTVTAPIAASDAEVRYMTGQGAKVLARRPVKIVTPDVSLSAPAEAVAGSNISVTWTGPANQGDYITVVPSSNPDGQYGNYTLVTNGSPLKVKLLMESGEAELRYMTGRGAKVLARRLLRIVAAEVSLSAPDAVAADSAITVTWTGPANEGDYITVVARSAPDSQYGNYTSTAKGSPLTVRALKDASEAEIRYASGQGGKVLARRSITITP